jgi:hypothetical protein
MCGFLAVYSTALAQAGPGGQAVSGGAPTAPPTPPPAITAPFTVHTIATGIGGGYQVVATDVNHDGKTDLIGLGLTADSLMWYENPSWTPHVIVSVPRMVNMDAADLDGDGIPEIGLAYGFNPIGTKSTGNIGILHSNGDPRSPWTVKEIDQEPATHRVRFANIAGDGKMALVAAPILNVQAKGFPDPDHLPTPLLMYRAGDWKREVITEENRGVVHGLLSFDWYGDGRQDVLTAGYSGVFVHSYGKDGTWKRVEITAGSPAPWPKGGAGDVVVGKLSGKQFFVTIEPFHGNMVVVYTQDSHGQYQRNVIDTDLVTGHALTLVDVDGDGIPEIVAGGNGSRANLFFYKAADATGREWKKALMDNDMSAQSCVTTDIKGDKRNNDVVCLDGRSPNSLRWYEYKGK